jgi:valyl-tRNA synthetase
MDRWILSRLEATVAAVTEGIEGYALGSAVGALYDFAWHDLCDWYLESAKSRLRDADPAARAVSLHVLDALCRLLHPFMPFVTEELWHLLPGDRDFLVRATWPEVNARLRRPDIEGRVERLQAIVEEVRSSRKRLKAPAKGGWLAFEGVADRDLAALVAELAAIEVVPELNGAGVALAEVSARVAFPATKANGAGRDKELRDLRAELDRASAKLANADFVARAPEAVVEKQRSRKAEIEAALARLEA